MSEITIAETHSPGEFQADSLRLRASTSPRSSYTQHYKAECGSSELAFVSVDIRPNCDFLVLYEIFVDPRQRRLGFGTRIVGLVEQLALRRGRHRIILFPRPLDSTIAEIDLRAWYGRLGYKPRDDLPIEVEKFLTPTAATREK